MKKITYLFIVVASLFTYSASAQNDSENLPKGPQTIIGVFDGFDQDEYSFICEDAKGEEETMFFESITPEALKMANLKDNKFISTKFEIQYTVGVEEDIDEDGLIIQVIVKTIIGLKEI